MNKTKKPVIKLRIDNGRVIYEAESGWEIEFLGADFTQLVDDNLVIHTPLNDSYAVLSFRCVKDGCVYEEDCRLFLKGICSGIEEKPPVVPQPAQWHATGGVLKKIDSYSCDEKLKEQADLFAEEFSRVTGRKISKGDNSGVSFILDSRVAYLGEEGYELECKNGKITVRVNGRAGVVWAGKTISQLMLTGGVPNGIMRDYPRYSVRGFMLDVGRRPVSLSTLEKIVDSMAWLKMNDFQIHLSDNYIFLEDYAENGDESTFDAYQAFRLESDMKNEQGESATAKDYFYTKDEFRDFIVSSNKKGVRIVPEIDVPAHALAFTKAFPEYAVYEKVSPLMKSRPLTDHIDISKPEAVDFVKRIFDEYTQGSNPVFPKNTTVHIGADEFLSDYTAYRNFINELVPYIKKSNPVRLWGGLTWIKDEPETPIISDAVENVEMNLWSSDWADGREMYDKGYKLINTIDNLLYIVPNGTKIRAPYMDFINKQRAFKGFEPNRVRLKGGKYINLPAGNKQVVGGCFAIWQDNIDKRCKGINEDDLYHRFADSAAVISVILWGSRQEIKSASQIDELVHRINKNIQHKTRIYAPVKDITLTGGNCFFETGFENLPTGKSIEITMELSEAKAGQIILESDAPYGTHDIRITNNLKLGFTAQGYEYEFDYKITPGKMLKFVIDTKMLRTYLKYGLMSRKKALGSFSFNGTVRCRDIKNTSFSIPLRRVGSKTNSVKGVIHSITVK